MWKLLEPELAFKTGEIDGADIAVLAVIFPLNLELGVSAQALLLRFSSKLLL